MTSRLCRIMGCGDRVGEEKQSKGSINVAYARKIHYTFSVNTTSNRPSHTYRKQIEAHLAHSGMITTAYCRKVGIPTIYLSRLLREGVIKRVERGVYLAGEGSWDEYYFFQHRYTKAIFSYETALHLLGVIDKIPQVMDVTVNRSYKFNEAMDGVLVHYVEPRIHELGVVEAPTMFGNHVRVYSYERTLCDFIAHRAQMDREIFVKTVRSYEHYAGKDIHALYEIATIMGIIKEVRAIMEVVCLP